MPGRDRGRSRSRSPGRLRSAVHSPVRSRPPEGSSTDAPIREPMRAELVMQAFGERHDRGLRRRVDRGARHGDDAAIRRRRVDDVPILAVLDHVRQEHVDAVGDAEHVDAEGPAPVVRRVEPQLGFGRRSDAGVVAQHVDVAEPRRGRVASRSSTEATSVTSVGTPSTSAPCVLQRSRSWRRAHPARRPRARPACLRRRTRSTMARPMPLAAPVTTAVRSVSESTATPLRSSQAKL